MQGRCAPCFILMTIAIVILNWNGRSFLEKFLPSVVSFSPPMANVIIADNASTDDSVSFLKTNYPDLDIIHLDKNYGFTGGYNRALKKVKADYYILLNSDVEVTAGWIEPMKKFMDEHPEVAACQPKIRSQIDRHLFEHAGACGGFIDFLGYPFCRGRIFDRLEEDREQYQRPVPVFWATGACLFIRAEAFHSANGFDEYFFAHMEEIDLCWRIQQRGQSIYVIPDSTVYHVGGGTLPKSNPRKTYFNFRNNLIMLFKNLPGHRLLWLIPVRLMLDGLAGIKFLWDGDRKDTLAVIKAHFAFYRYAITHFTTRFRAQRKVKVHPERGTYHGSIIIDYYLRKKKFFKDLPFHKFS